MTARLLATLTAAAEKLERVRSAATAAVFDAAHDYVTAEVVAYSRAHPRRLVTFCSAMGATTLSVQKGGWQGAPGITYNEYAWGGAFQDANPPAFMIELERIAEENDLGYGMTGPRLLKCKGGEIIADLSDW